MRDKDIRDALHSSILSHYHEDPNTLVIDEFNICQGESRADIVVINGLIHGYEIKSKSDNLNRLPDQIMYYSMIMDKVTLVVDDSHYENAKEMLPNWWGIKVVSSDANNKLKIKSIRREKRNKSLNNFAIAQLLWRDELIDILGKKDALKGVKSKPKIDLWNRLVDVTTIDELQSIVRQTLKSRSNWRVG
ncbi:sce7726 family protein [Wohlfahrtiimonas chitiniclastica]|uniref:sce7726 family protein n=1 Tax=Wohlfahrtiimonas chitiniclastica TaxID=400946 RepID=UPI000B9994A9|nr:sce7726 family protein [Wohlfahrtiimonas chitiniclastica]OYQ85109.1 hypothetical protein B9T14_01115 [Wohlfahrtiimonas chitiniclastica]OYQ86657.1 hypothetical protein B9T15_03925 [Wohlfahrtiimonas chitiniclastica]